MFPRIALVTALVCHAVPAFAQPAAPPGATEDVASVISSFEGQEKALEATIAPQLAAAKTQLQGQLQAIAAKLTQSRKSDVADRVKAELAALERNGVPPAPERASTPDVRTAISAYLRVAQAAEQSIALKRNSIRSKYMHALVAAERAARAANDLPAANRARRAQQSLSIRQAVADSTRLATTEVAGRDRDPWRDVPKGGMPLIGFKGATGGWFQFTVLGSLQPIFLAPEGPTDGRKRGHAGDGPSIVAKEGYAVGGILVKSGEVIDGLQILFMRMKPDGLSLDPQDFYISDWLGAGGGKGREITAKGKLVVGVTGTTTSVVESLGLVFLK